MTLFHLQSPQPCFLPPRISRLTQTSSSSTRTQGTRGSNNMILLQKSMPCSYWWNNSSPNNAPNRIHKGGKWKLSSQNATDKLECVSNNSNVKFFRIHLQNSSQVFVNLGSITIHGQYFGVSFVLTVKASGGTGTGSSFTSVLTAQIPSSLPVHSHFGLTVLPSSFRFTKVGQPECYQEACGS